MSEFYSDGQVTLYHGEARDVLTQLPAESVQCVVTSPPYWGLRDYGTATWEGGDAECGHLKPILDSSVKSSTLGANSGGRSEEMHRRSIEASREPYRDTCGKCGARRIDAQLGLEPTPEAYVDAMVDVFRHVRRVLRDDGVVFLNIGDSYWNTSASGPQGATGQRASRTFTAAGLGAGALRGERNGTRGTASPDSRGGGPLSESLCGECEAILSPRNPDSDGNRDRALPASRSGSIHARTGPLIARQGSSDSTSPDARTEGDTSDRDSALALPADAALDAQASTIREPSPLPPERCSHCGNCGACQAVLASSSRDARLCVRRGQYMDGTLPLALVGRSQDMGVSDSAWGYSTTTSLKPKDLVGIPWLLAFALRADGWWLRQDIIWSKPNPMPESVRDRCTKAHEYLFLLSKSERYWYDQDAIRENFADERMGNPGAYKWSYANDADTGRGIRGTGGPSTKLQTEGWNADGTSQGRNKRSVWHIATAPFPEAHFATFPPALVEPCILAGSREGDTVLDPFIDSGTTAMVARNLGRRAIGIDLNAEYLAMAKRRVGEQLALLDGAR